MFSHANAATIALMILMALTLTTTTTAAFSPQPLHKAHHSVTRIESRLTFSSSHHRPLVVPLLSSPTCLKLSSTPESDEEAGSESSDESTTSPTSPPTTKPEVISSVTASRAPASVSAEAIAAAQERAKIQAEMEKPPPRPMDPLVRSLTRMDQETMNAPTKNIPLLGEVVMDRSLFLFVPAAVFAVLGFFLSLYVLLNSGDAIVDSVTSGIKVSPTPPTPMFSADPETAASEACRGLCSSQEQDLEGLRNFMSNFGK